MVSFVMCLCKATIPDGFVVSLPGAFAVWCASDEAAFLHGRFVWSAWDVEELKSGSIRNKLDKDVQFLRIGVHGL